jgi:flagellar hook-basal body complex protein FliE
MAIGAIPPINPAINPVSSPDSAIGSIGSIGASPSVDGSNPSGFGDMVKKSLESASAAEFQADDLVKRMAAGEDIRPHEIMIANSKAQLSVELIVQARNKALDAYREVMNLQI